jgi:hypothetical protein
MKAPTVIRTPVRIETERADYLPFNDVREPASVNALAAAMRTNLLSEFLQTYRGRRRREGHRSHSTNSFARSFQKRQQP